MNPPPSTINYTISRGSEVRTTRNLEEAEGICVSALKFQHCEDVMCCLSPKHCNKKPDKTNPNNVKANLFSIGSSCWAGYHSYTRLQTSTYQSHISKFVAQHASGLPPSTCNIFLTRLFFIVVVGGGVIASTNFIWCFAHFFVNEMLRLGTKEALIGLFQ